MDTTSADTPVRNALARSALAAWKDSFPADPFTSDRHLRSILDRSLEPRPAGRPRGAAPRTSPGS